MWKPEKMCCMINSEMVKSKSILFLSASLFCKIASENVFISDSAWPVTEVNGKRTLGRNCGKVKTTETFVVLMKTTLEFSSLMVFIRISYESASTVMLIILFLVFISDPKQTLVVDIGNPRLWWPPGKDLNPGWSNVFNVWGVPQERAPPWA